jgi:hypothetical protein
MPKYIFIGLIDKPTKVLHKDISMEKLPTFIPDYTTINKRMNKLDIKIKDDCSSRAKK